LGGERDKGEVAAAAAVQRRVAETKRTEQREGDAGAADEEIFPRGLEGAGRGVEVKQGNGGERERLGGDPQQAEVTRLEAGAEQTEHREHQRDEHAVGTFGAHGEVGNAVGGADEEEQGNGGQQGPRERIESEPRFGGEGGRMHEHPEDEDGMEEAGGGQQPRARALARPDGGEGGGGERKEDEQQCVHSRSTVSLRVSRESNARWMRSTMMPMTKTPTTRSRRMPDSTRSGVDLISRRPKR
jgi:hypothetical protein